MGRRKKVAGQTIGSWTGEVGVQRRVGTLEPLWNLFDLTREGRPATWHEQFSY
jgi:hypothetical protein